MKKRRDDVNGPLKAKLEKFEQHFHQAVEEIEEKYNCSCKLPFRAVASGSRAPWLLHTSNTVFLKCGHPSGFWPHCC